MDGNTVNNPILNNNRIEAHPTKELFISMLIRDIKLTDAIADLVDNCIDGAKNIRPDNDYRDLQIKIDLDENAFTIYDTCGGFSAQIARDYAFRFGRDVNAPSVSHSIGQFGIGMKRALFKIGNSFHIESYSETSKFSIKIDVDTWKKNKDDWNFEFESFEENLNIPVKERFTKITITDLREDVKNQFRTQNFIKTLREDLSLTYMYSIEKKLQIMLNQTKLKQRDLGFLLIDKMKIGSWENTFDNGVSVKVKVGVAKDDLKEGGWYIFCNERLILGKEQTEISGWSGKGAGEGTPKYHDQYDRFRGYVFFDAADSSTLPWNTTKSGMDLDSPIFIKTRAKMIEMMKPITTFLNKIKAERDKQEKGFKTQAPTIVALNSARPVSISNISPNDIGQKFEAEMAAEPKIVKEPDTYKIIYEMNKDKVKKVKEFLNITELESVGRKTFEYFYKSEIE